MTTTDIDVLIRDRAYEIWELAGRPNGEEHRHWAEARRQIEHETFAAQAIVLHAAAADTAIFPADAETLRMRDALYRPECFSLELFGSDAMQDRAESVEPRIGHRHAVFASGRGAAIAA